MGGVRTQHCICHPCSPPVLPGKGESHCQHLCHSASKLGWCGSWEQALLYLVGQVCIDLVLEPLLHVRVSGQVVGYVAKGGTGGLITSKDKDERLGQNLLIT